MNTAQTTQKRITGGRGRWSWLASLVVAIVALAATLVFPFSRTLELKSRDLRAAIAGTAEVTAPVVLVTIDDVSFEQINIRWPWPREIIAQAIREITAAGASVIGLDIMMGDAGYSSEEDQALSQAIAESGIVVLPAKFDRSVQSGIQIDYYDVPLPRFSSGAASVGYINFLTDRDGYVRSIVPREDLLGTTERAFALEILSRHDRSLPESAPSLDRPLIIDYARAGAFQTVPFHQVVDQTAPADVFGGAIVLIGAFFKESHDLFLTPVESSSGLYGMEIHANVINTLVSGRFLRDTAPGLDIVILVLLGVASAAVLVRFKPVTGLGIALGTTAAYFIVATVLFGGPGVIVDLVEPVLVLTLVWVGSVVYRYLVVDRQRQKVRATFSRFVSSDVVDSMLDSGRQIELGGETREITIFFSDICGFTPLSESMNPAEVVEMLNDYFTVMTEIIFSHGGTVNKYIGDAIMAFYGAPVALPDASARAVSACLDMREALARFNANRAAAGKPEIAIGMGLHKGEVLVGNIGSPRQMEYTVIGDAVNVSSRIEGLTRGLNTDLLISDDVYREVADLVTVKTHEPVAVKGKSQSIVVHSVTGLRSNDDT